MDSIKCPHCGKQVELSEAIVHELSKAQVDKARAEEREKTEREQKEKALQENKGKEKELEDLRKKLARKNEEDKKRQEQIKEDAKKEAEKDQKLKLKEKDIQIDQIKRVAEDFKRANEDLKRKLDQGSQQLKGEALELNFEEELRKYFQADEFVPVPKGVEGGDIWQKVKYQGKIIGSIIWETKRTKAWSKGWLTKLKEDAAKINASEAIVVSQTLPRGISNFDRQEGVWISSYENALSVCRYVRYLLAYSAKLKSTVSQTDEEWGKIREYMMSDAFTKRMQSHFDGIKALRELHEKEKRSAILRWKEEEETVDKLDNNTLNFYGELKARVPELPDITDIDVPLLQDAQDENNEQTLF